MARSKPDARSPTGRQPVYAWRPVPIPPMPSMLAIKRANTILYCRRWKETVVFYRDRLGLPVAFQNDWLVEFRLAPESYLSIADLARTSMESAAGKGITLSFQVDHLQQVREELAATGLSPTVIRSPVMGGAVFYLWDPEGHRIEFWSPVTSR